MSHKGKLPGNRWKIVQNETFVCIREIQTIREDGFYGTCLTYGVGVNLICDDNEFCQVAIETIDETTHIAKLKKKDFETCFEKTK